jgi:CubicO group peptidase (beta-lactamase class C family)
VRDRARTLLGVMTALALALTALVVARAHSPRGLVWSDEIVYAVVARNIAEGHGPVSSFVHPDSILARGLPLADVHLPAHAYLLSVGMRLLGPGERVPEAVGSVAFVLAALAVFALGRMLADDAAGVWAAALFAFFPSTAAYGASGMSEATFFPLVAGWWLVWCVALRDRRAWQAGALGLALALTATHHETALALLLPAAFALWRWPSEGRRSAALAFAAGFLPWMALVFWPLYRARAPYPHVVSFVMDSVRETGSLRPFADTVARNLQPWSHPGVGLALYAFIVACAVAAVALSWHRRDLGRSLAAWTALVMAATFVVLAPLHVLRGWIPVRMFVVLIPPALAVIACGLASRRSRLARQGPPAIVLAVCLALSVPANAWLARDRREHADEGRAYSVFVRQHVPAAARVVIAERAYRYGWDAYPVTVIDVDVDGLRFEALAKRTEIDAVVTSRSAPYFLATLKRHGLESASPSGHRRSVFSRPSIQEPVPASDPSETMRRMLVRLHESGEFNGAVLVARDGVPVYRDAITAPASEAPSLLDEPVDIGSVAKGFTAMAVMMLAEQGKLRYDDPVGPYLPPLAEAVPAVTLRHLLTHTSGIPDVGDLGIDRPDLEERDVVEAVRAQHGNFARPGLRYRYSNAGYNLLAMVVAKASGEHFDDFVQRSIFAPLGMSRTRPASGRRATGAVKGDGGLVSTLDDLLRWDQALATGKLVRAKTLEEGLSPVHVAEGTSTYAFGWNVAPRKGDSFIWHTGNSGGRRAFLGRRVGERITVIILTNGDSRRLEIADAVIDILHHRPYTPPRLSIARQLMPVVKGAGVGGAIAAYHRLRATESNVYDFGEGELNGLGYTLLGTGDVAGAIQVFELNAQQYPGSSNVFDSLGEAYARANRREDARKAYARVIALDPGNANARAMLQGLTEVR